jgi:predicted signal transduction protein with EAL and GGDEF domain
VPRRRRAVSGYLGAGVAGLTLLRRLCPEFARLDRALVRGLDGDPARARLLASFATEAHELGVRVVCDGIEPAGSSRRLARSAPTSSRAGCSRRPRAAVGRSLVAPALAA